ncbi:MAG: sodium:calcium antiporter [Actinomycetota bacterium]
MTEAAFRRSLGRKSWVSLVVATAVTLPGLFVRLGFVDAPVELATLFYGVAIMGSAFLLAWAAEVAQLDVSQTLAIAVLAIIAVLPEYAVDLFLAFRAGQGDPEAIHFAVANMTGANRLLIGIGWAAVVLVYWAKTRKREVRLRPVQRIDVGYLLVATLWAFTIPLRRQLSLLDLVVLGGLFIAYIVRAAKEEVEEPELIGAAALIGSFRPAIRRTVTVVLFLFAATAILATAEPFAHGLIGIGEEFGINPFLLIQWVAPLASESPEMVVAILFTVRLKAQAGLGTLISSKVNQWTLLVGTLPLVFSIGGGAGAGFGAPMHMDGRQVEEVFLTAAQSLFAVAVIANLSISRLEAVALLVLFLGQLPFEATGVRYGFGVAYLLLTVGMLVFRRDARRSLWDSIVHVVRPRGARGG